MTNGPEAPPTALVVFDEALVVAIPGCPATIGGADPVPIGLLPRWNRRPAQAVPEVRHARNCET
jgi:hypothetical protein